MFFESTPKKHKRYSAKVLREGSYEVLQLVVTTVNKAMDYVCFSTSVAHPHLHLLRVGGSELPLGQTIALCSFQLHLGQHELTQFGIGLAAFPVS